MPGGRGHILSLPHFLLNLENGWSTDSQLTSRIIALVVS